MDQELLASLWSLLCCFYWDTYQNRGRMDLTRGSNLDLLITRLWVHYFKLPIDTIPGYWRDCREQLRKYYFEAKWFEVYDFIEFISENGDEEKKPAFIKQANAFLESENSAYRFMGGRITEITSAEEIAEFEKAVVEANSYSGVKSHLQSALLLLCDRKNPDFRNSIKESVSAVESLAKHLSGNASSTLGAILSELELKGKVHPALKRAFSALYGYTSDTDGIRHALLEESNLTKADARFMLICCSAFINYALDKARTK